MKRFLSLALLVAAMLSASVGASAKGRKAEVVVKKKGDVRKEIRFQDKRCPQGREADFRFKAGPKRRADMRCCERCRHLDPRFRDPHFRPRHELRPCPPQKRHHRKAHHRK
ncbi:MAG: hypothetical protein IKG86_03735 [Paludibacteraceae bacterium]|nr:hypothetical protein [Paludibacteraceae bacterium]